MKYSLRSLMIVVTLVCVVLGGMMGRIEYCRRWANFHEEEVSRCASKLHTLFDKPASAEFESYTREMSFHEDYAKLFRNASAHPWKLVSEPDLGFRQESARRPDVRNGHTVEIVLPDSSAPAPNPPKP